MRVQKQMAQTSNIHHLLCKCSIPLAVQWAIIVITIMRDIKYQYEVYGFMVFNVTFNNISAISWWLVLLVEETAVPEENP
jgi:hypothetical protein